jgi:VPDSG-CTERM motif
LKETANHFQQGKIMSNSTLKILPALILAIIAALVTQPVFGSVEHQLIITENSSSSLSVTFDGSTSGITVTDVRPDGWLVALPFVITSEPRDQWVEPENSNQINIVEEFPVDSIFLNVFSDELNTTPFPVYGNGSSVPFGTDPSDGIAISATFNDNAATAEVPDTGTTGSLFGLSLMGLVFLRRKLPA